jgi:hypothetical protein
MKYLLFVYPCNEEWDSTESNQKIAEELSTISKSDEIKYVYGENHSIFHFDSTLSPSEMNTYVELIKDEMSEFMFVLVQGVKSVESNMEGSHLEHLLRVNKRGRKPKSNPIKETLQNNQPGFDITKLMEEYKTHVQEFLKNETCDLALDEILDKITDQGIGSLTRAEKDKLDEYSKQI